MKTCSKCGKEKPLEEFPKQGCQCKTCRAEYMSQYQKEHPEVFAKSGRKWRISNPEKGREKHRRLRKLPKHKETERSWRECNPDKCRKSAAAYDKRNREKRRQAAVDRYHRDPARHIQKVLNYQARNPEKIAAYRHDYGRIYVAKRRKIDFGYKMLAILRLSAYRFLKGKTDKSDKALGLAGCNLGHYKNHLKSGFTVGMSEGNHGRGKGKWHVDHIIPCSLFDPLNEDDHRVCFNWRNLQPMWENENGAKSNKSCFKSLQKLLALLDAAPPVDETDAMVVATLRAMAQTLLEEATLEVPEAS